MMRKHRKVALHSHFTRTSLTVLLLIYFQILILGESLFSQSMDVTLNDSSKEENPSYQEKKDKGRWIMAP